MWSRPALRPVVALLLLVSSRCQKPYPAPSAVIGTLPDQESSEPQLACTPLAAALPGSVGVPVPLTAGCSSDDSSLVLSYHWSIAEAPPGSTSVLANAEAVTPTLVPDVRGTFRVRLVVYNGVVTSEPALAVVEVGACGDHAPLVALHATNGAPHVGELVTLSADVSDDDTAPACAAHAATFDETWKLVDLPPGSRASLNAESARSPSFLPDVPGSYTVEMVATDPTGRASEPALLDIEVSSCGNHPPVVDGIAVEPSTAPASGQPVTLRPSVTDLDLEPGCASHAPVFTASWQILELPAGSGTRLDDPHALTASFTPDLPGGYRLLVDVADPDGNQASAEVTVTASQCGAASPVVSASVTPEGPSVGSGVSLRAAALDADLGAPCFLRQTLDYTWNLREVPAGSAAVLGNPHGVVASLLPDVPGTYVADVVVADGTGRESAPAEVSVVVNACGVSPPEARLVRAAPGPVTPCGAAPLTTELSGGKRILLDAAPSFDSDVTSCGLYQYLDYDWTLLTTPIAGGASKLESSTGQTTVLEVKSDGEYHVRLVVTDSTGRSSRELVCAFEVHGSG